MPPTEQQGQEQQVPQDADGKPLDLPPAVIAQAEAAASNTTTKDPHAVRDTARSRPSVAEGADLFNAPANAPIEQEPPPVYSDAYGQVDFNQDGFDTRAKVAGRQIHTVFTLHVLTDFKTTDESTSTSIRNREDYLTFSPLRYAASSTYR